MNRVVLCILPSSPQITSPESSVKDDFVETEMQDRIEPIMRM
ncbi:hypothetical protein [Pseudorhizobium flavum]|nr:hypothetical protein [Pseudorhizobium flavum]